MKYLLLLGLFFLALTSCKTHIKSKTTEQVKMVTDTIPFSLGKDNGIHVKGVINNSEPLDFLFDTGANSFVITSSLIGNKVNIELDGQAMNNGGGGSSMMQISTDDKIEIETFKWENSPIISIPYQNHSFDGVFGLNAFQNKVVEIDYDLNKLIVHNSMKSVPKGYTKIESKKEFELFFLKALVDVDGNQTDDWFLYDTGNNSNIMLSQDFAKKQNINGVMDILGSGTSMGSAGVSWVSNMHKLPKFKLDNYILKDILISVNETDPPGPHFFNILGNGLMKHFNTILDLKNNAIYIKPNKQYDNPNTHKF